MKKNIDLVIDGIAPEKVMYDTDNHSLVVLYPAQEEFKRGDILASDDILLIFEKYEMFNQEKDLFHSLWNNIGKINKNWITKYFTYATDEQKAQVHELLRKESKKWNAEKLQVEDIVEEFKRGDILASDDILLIFDKYVMFNQEKDIFRSLWNNMRTAYNKNWTSKNFVHATDEQKAQVHELLRKKGKKWNAEKLQVEDIKPEFKKGDIVIHDNTKRVSIFDSYENKYSRFNAIFSIDRAGNIGYNRSWNTDTIRYATSYEIEKLDNDLKEIGKKWNRETLQVEDIDISEIVIDLVSACEYLGIKRPSFFILDGACERSEKFETQITLQLMCEAWNKADGFEVDWENRNQLKHAPKFEVKDGKIEFSGTSFFRVLLDFHTSNFSFKTEERAIQFGTQFKELFKTAMGM